MKPISIDLKQKLGGSHTTIIGGRKSYKVVKTISKNEEIKNIIPSIISYKNKIKNGGLSYRIQRPDEHGNLRLLLSFGSSYQEIVLITRVANNIEGIKLQEELNILINKLKK